MVVAWWPVGGSKYPGEFGVVFVKILAAVPAMTVRDNAPFGTACAGAVKRINESRRGDPKISPTAFFRQKIVPGGRPVKKPFA